MAEKRRKLTKEECFEALKALYGDTKTSRELRKMVEEDYEEYLSAASEKEYREQLGAQS
ncbi:MAG: hypothetical protein J5449_03805 [Oscillospiraceae bacterium]|nr:hypothetical protein [Oscillospiraceae bacterium]